MGSSKRRVISVKVDFGGSEIGKVQSFGSCVPQLFDENVQPILAVNQYMRTQSLRLARRSLDATREHLVEFMEWLLSSQLRLEDMDEDTFENYVEALCSYKKMANV